MAVYAIAKRRDSKEWRVGDKVGFLRSGELLSSCKRGLEQGEDSENGI